MPLYRSTYPYSRYFPTLGINVEPDEVIERDENPDGNFFVEVEETPPAPAGPPAPPAPPAPPVAPAPESPAPAAK